MPRPCRHASRIAHWWLEQEEQRAAVAKRPPRFAMLEAHVSPRMDGIEERLDSGDGKLPGNFLGSEAMPKALAVVHRALGPGGHLLNACLGGGGDDRRSTAARLRAVLWGGDTVAPEDVADLIRKAGFDEVALMDRLPSELVPMQARRRP